MVAERITVVETQIAAMKEKIVELAAAGAATQQVIASTVMERVDGIENQISDMTSKLCAFENGLASQKKEFADEVDAQLAQCKVALVEVVTQAQTEFTRVKFEVNLLHNKTAETFKQVEVAVREARELGPVTAGGGGGKQKGYIPAKHCTPDKFGAKEEQWRKWQDLSLIHI